MFDLLKDRFATARLKARYQRLMQERVLTLLESDSPQPVSEDPGRWSSLGADGSLTGKGIDYSNAGRNEIRQQARHLVTNNPHAHNMLRLMEIYIAGPGLKLSHHPSSCNKTDASTLEICQRADQLWRQFLDANQRHFSFRETVRRTCRDGETFLRLYDDSAWPPTLRYVDPEQIAATSDQPDSQGIITSQNDVEDVTAYLRINPTTGESLEEIPADAMLHIRFGTDSNQKRGVTMLLPILDTLAAFEKWQETELVARKLQASIVLWRKVHGSPSQASAFADAAMTGSTTGLSESIRRERYSAGTILTTSQGTDLQFLQPNTNFGDAAPLGRALLLCMAAGAGLPEFMLTSDASNANYASTMVAEGPAVKMFQAEQQFFVGEFTQLWRWVMLQAISQHLLPVDFFKRVVVEWTFPQLVNRDRPKEREADTRLVDSGILSRAEVARRDGVDPHVMQSEIEIETSGGTDA